MSLMCNSSDDTDVCSSSSPSCSTVTRYYPPGMRFTPTDEELVTHYLRNKVSGRDLPYYMIPEVNIYAYSLDELAESHPTAYANEWYFFTMRERKNKNGSQPSRLTKDGYWRTIAKFEEIKSRGCTIGFKRVLDFFYNNPERKADNKLWKMVEYTLTMDERDVWVLCKIYKNKRSTKDEE